MAMTDAQRRFADARDELITQFYSPFAKMLDAAQAAVVEADRRAQRAETELEVLREVHEGATAELAKALGGGSLVAAAAYDLLEALEGLVSDDVDWGHRDMADLEREVSLGNEMVVPVIKARKAIAKARGQTEG